MPSLTPPNLSDTEKAFSSFIQSLVDTLYQIRKNPLRNKWLPLAVLWFFAGSPTTLTWSQQHFGLWQGKTLPLGYTYWYWIVLAILLLLTLVAQFNERIQNDRLPSTIPLPSDSPVKGLLAFDFQDADLFRNLQRETDISRVRNGLLTDGYRLGVLVGVSGCGKTSLLRAGLAPRLRTTTHTCVVATLTNESPLQSIFTALRSQLSLKSLILDSSLQHLLQSAMAQVPQSTLVLILDQFEQFYVHNPLADQQLNFTTQLLAAAQSADIRFLISLRADSLYRVLPLLGTLRADDNYFEVKKIETPQAVRIFQYMAEQAGAECDTIFMEGLLRRELADQEDRIIATDIQILALVLQSRQQRMNFTEQAVQKSGGITGLLQQYVETELATPNAFNQDNALLLTLLALVETDQNRRAGQLTEAAIDQKLNSNVKSLPTILSWLASRRLIRQIDEEGKATQYELAHERLIEPLRNIENKTEAGPRQASTLLDRRTNEWLGNGRISRYLLPLGEYRQIKKWEPLLTWGEQRQPKEDLLRGTWLRLRNWGAVSIWAFLFLSGWWGIRQTTYHQLNYQAPDELKRLITDYLQPQEQTVVLDSLALIEPEEVLQIANNTLGVDKNDISRYSCKGLLGQKRFQQARAVADSINKPEDKAAALQDISLSIAEAGQFQQAIAVAKQISDDYFSLHNRAATLRDIALCMAKAGRFQQARLATNLISIDGGENKIIALRGVAEELVKAKATGYITLFKQARTLASSDGIFDVVSSQTFVEDMANAGQFQLARTVADSITDPGFKSYSLEYIAIKMAEAGHSQQAQAMVNSITDPNLKAYILQAIATAMAKIGQFQQARAVADSIDDFATKEGALRDIVIEIAKAGRFHQALEVANSIDQSDNKEAALQSIIETIIKVGQFQQAYALANSINNPATKATALYSIAAAMGKVKVTGYISMLEQASTVALSIDNTDSRDYILRDIVLEMARIGQFQKARAITNSIKHSYNKMAALGDIAVEMAKVKSTGYTTLLQLIINEPSTTKKSLTNIAVELAEIGQFQQASVLANSFNNPDDRASFLQAIAEKLADMRKFGDAYKVAQNMSDTQINKGLTLVHILKKWRQRDK